MQLETFKSEIGQILDRYQIPMDDKSFILEKVEGQFGALAQEMTKFVQAERLKDQEKMVAYEQQVKAAVSGSTQKAQETVKQAYKIGVKEGIGQAPKAAAGPSLFNILLTSGLLALAGFVVFREFFPKKKDE